MKTDDRPVDQRAMRDVVPLAIWTLVWLATLAVARFGPDLIWDSEPAIGWIAIGVNLAAGVGWIIAHARFLRRVDELQRKILVEAMALALGVGVVGGFAFAAASASGVIAFDANVGLFAAALAVIYAVASVVGTLRYR